MTFDKVLVLGGGGREDTLAWKLSQSPAVSHVYVSPGNAGTEQRLKTSNVALDLESHDCVVRWCQDNAVTTVVVGPEAYLAQGISDTLQDNGIDCFGPSAKAAVIEASKEFAKGFMQRWGIPTAQGQAFTTLSEAEAYMNGAEFPALVVKASGLAAGKGVILAKDRAEACQAARDILQNQIFGKAGSTILIEELLHGEEISCLAFTDGDTVHVLPPVQDHKKLLEGDKGPNTGGMGAYCPYPWVNEDDLKIIEKEILQKAVDGLKQEGRRYKGVLYAGLMLTQSGPKVLEFNCRFGDPETQVLMPLMTSDLYPVVKACIHGNLQDVIPEFSADKSTVAVVTVSRGYPGKYKKGEQISGMEAVENKSNRMIFHAGTVSKNGRLVTSGGRVLSVVATDTDLSRAAHRAQTGAADIQYTGKEYRTDIAHRALKHFLTYSESGVSIDAGDRLVQNIQDLVQSTLRPGCVSRLGMFGAAYDLKQEKYKDPLLVTGTDGVGTKLKIAQSLNKHGTIGTDLVAMCVNDILCHGAEPLFFLDYFACGNLEVGVASQVIEGVAKACKEAGCALIGGETAEMPGMYGAGEYDIAGFTVGAVERADYLPQPQTIHSGDHVIGLASSGIHSNGFSLVRKIVEKNGLSFGAECPFQTDKTLGDVLLEPTTIYVKPILALLETTKVKAIAHITGGGLPGNITRILPDDCRVTLDASQWDVPVVFQWIASQGNIETTEMARTLNCGIGLVLVVDRQQDTGVICDRLQGLGCKAWHIGNTGPWTSGQEKVEIKNLSAALRKHKGLFGCVPHQLSNGSSAVCNGSNGYYHGQKQKKKVAVLISGSGTNLKAILDHTLDPVNEASSEIALVISNKAGVKGLTLAEAAGVPTKVISHKDFPKRELFDGALHEELVTAHIDIVCLAGFMRILTGGFVRKWDGRMLNIHPSLLPSFKGHNAHEQVLQARVRISGCTVHFVAEEVDAGAVIAQESVSVSPDDTIDTLSARVKTAEHKAFPRALELVASERAVLGGDGTITWT